MNCDTHSVLALYIGRKLNESPSEKNVGIFSSLMMKTMQMRGLYSLFLGTFLHTVGMSVAILFQKNPEKYWIYLFNLPIPNVKKDNNSWVHFMSLFSVTHHPPTRAEENKNTSCNFLTLKFAFFFSFFFNS